MKQVFWILFLFLFVNCENKKSNIAEDNTPTIDVDIADFDFELIGDVLSKMKKVTAIRVLKKNDLEVHQTLDGFEAIVQENEQVIVEDINFDGFLDIRLLQYLPETANFPFFYWLYNPKTEKFERNIDLEIIQSPSLDLENKYVLSQWTTNEYVRGTDYYKFDGSSRIQLMKQEIQEYTDSLTYMFIVKELVGDSLQTTKMERLKRNTVLQ